LHVYNREGNTVDNKTTAEKFLMLSQVREIVPYSASHIWRLERSGQFPRRVRLGGNRVAWLQSEVNSWVESKLASRDDNSQRGNAK
jgi:prophage regulatory protein